MQLRADHCRTGVLAVVIHLLSEMSHYAASAMVL
jgi:hypothetical protein